MSFRRISNGKIWYFCNRGRHRTSANPQAPTSNSRQGSKPSKQIRKTTQAGWGELKGQSPGKQANGQTRTLECLA